MNMGRKETEMMKDRITIDEKLCRKVQLMLGSGASTGEVAELMGVSTATVSRIKKAGYSAKQYEENTKQRLMDEKKKTGATISAEEVIAAVTAEGEQVPGQMEMDLTPKTPEMSDQTKMMRFQAHQADRIMMMQQGIMNKLEKVNDTLSQILRRMDG